MQPPSPREPDLHLVNVKGERGGSCIADKDHGSSRKDTRDTRMYALSN